MIIKSRSGPWPKDFLKHLRTGHFALVTVSVVLILLSSNPSRSTVEIAREQNRQIGDLLHEFQISWLEDYVSVVVAQNHKEAVPNSAAPNPPFPKVRLDPADADTIQYSYANHTYPNLPQKTDVLLPINVEDENWILASSHLSWQHPNEWDYRMRLPVELSTKPTSLRDFHLFWDSLAANDLHLEIPHGLSNNAWVQHNGDPPMQSVPIKFLKTGDTKADFMSLAVLKDNDAKTLERLGLTKGIRYYYAIEHHQTPGLSELDRNGHDYAVVDSLIIPITYFDKIPYDGQAALLSHANSNWHWHHGTFSQVFEQLSEITKYYESLPPGTIDDVLASEEKRYGESFEALGIKFPAENTTLWGIIVILTIQVYLWIQLQEFDLRSHRAEAVEEVAWIGLYQSWRARALVFVTTCLLPFLAVGLLEMRSLHLVSHKWRYAALMVISATTTFGLGLLIWFRLPKGVKAPASESGVLAINPELDRVPQQPEGAVNAYAPDE